MRGGTKRVRGAGVVSWLCLRYLHGGLRGGSLMGKVGVRDLRVPVRIFFTQVPVVTPVFEPLLWVQVGCLSRNVVGVVRRVGGVHLQGSLEVLGT
eukprot:748470-Hanusia_phi.AAC.7